MCKNRGFPKKNQTPSKIIFYLEVSPPTLLYTLLGPDIIKSYAHEKLQFCVRYVGMPGEFQHVVTSVILFENRFASISYINLFLI